MGDEPEASEVRAPSGSLPESGKLGDTLGPPFITPGPVTAELSLNLLVRGLRRAPEMVPGKGLFRNQNQ